MWVMVTYTYYKFIWCVRLTHYPKYDAIQLNSAKDIKAKSVAV